MLPAAWCHNRSSVARDRLTAISSQRGERLSPVGFSRCLRRVQVDDHDSGRTPGGDADVVRRPRPPRSDRVGIGAGVLWPPLDRRDLGVRPEWEDRHAVGGDPQRTAQQEGFTFGHRCLLGSRGPQRPQRGLSVRAHCVASPCARRSRWPQLFQTATKDGPALIVIRRQTQHRRQRKHERGRNRNASRAPCLHDHRGDRHAAEPATRPGCRVRSAACCRLFVGPADVACKPITSIPVTTTAPNEAALSTYREFWRIIDAARSAPKSRTGRRRSRRWRLARRLERVGSTSRTIASLPAHIVGTITRDPKRHCGHAGPGFLILDCVDLGPFTWSPTEMAALLMTPRTEWSDSTCVPTSFLAQTAAGW